MLNYDSSVREWEQQYLCESASLAVPDEDRAAIEYHIICEEFDRRVCTGWDARTGEVRPANPSELSLINQNAERVRRDLQSAYPDVPPARLRTAIARWGRSGVTHEGLLQLCKRIKEDDEQQKRATEFVCMTDLFSAP